MVNLKAWFIEEPRIILGNNNISVDPKIGIISYGPYTLGVPSTIRAGIIGDGESISYAKRWLEELKSPIEGKEENFYLFPSFGGFNKESTFRCEIVIDESLIEKIDNKKIEEVVSDDTIISSQLSTLMISDLAISLKKPERAIGLHFIDPIGKTQIVEVVRGEKSSDQAYDKVSRFCGMLKKRVINVNESPGNISTRMIIPFINEACELFVEGVASIQDIDITMKEASGHHIGPFELADRIGLDKILKYMDNLYNEFAERKYKAPPIIKRLVRAGFLGRRTGKGFYNYEDGKTTSDAIEFIINKK